MTKDRVKPDSAIWRPTGVLETSASTRSNKVTWNASLGTRYISLMIDMILSLTFQSPPFLQQKLKFEAWSLKTTQMKYKLYLFMQ